MCGGCNSAGAKHPAPPVLLNTHTAPGESNSSKGKATVIPPPVNSNERTHNLTVPLVTPNSARKEILTPKFIKDIVQPERKDGYWVETFLLDPGDKVPGLLAYGLGSGDLSFFDNPANKPGFVKKKEYDDPTTGWPRYLVKQLSSPVAIVCGEIAGNGRQDIFCCHEYGETFWQSDPKGGNITWLENPGRKWLEKNGWPEWKDRFVGRWPAMHRMKCGYYSQSSYLELIAMSVVHGPFKNPGSQDINIPIPVLLYQRPEKVLDAIEWPKVIIDDENYTVIHDGSFPKRYYSKEMGGRDSMFVASREGLNWLHFNTKENFWITTHIGDGMPKYPGRIYYGTGGPDTGRVGDNSIAYIATVEPYHGPLVSVYVPKTVDPETIEYERHVLDIYGTPEQLANEGNGPTHYVVCADFDGDGIDEFLVALMGPTPHIGVYYYKPLDLQKGIFAKWKVAEESAARIAVADFTGDGTLDFATIVYDVPHYHEEANPMVHIYYNDFAPIPKISPPDPEIVITLWDNEPLFYLPKPTDIKLPKKQPIIEVAGYRIDLEILPPGSSSQESSPDTDEAVKVLWGEIILSDGSERTPLYIPAKEKASAVIPKGTAITTRASTEDKPAPGAIYLRFTSLVDEDTRLGWKDTPNDVPVKILLEFSYEHLVWPEDVMTWKKYIVYPSGPPECPNPPEPQDLDFYNLTGIRFRWNNTENTQLAHVQFWTCGKGVNCGVHNHNDEIFEEVHLCLSPGTGNGGMEYVKDGVEVDPCDPDGTPEEDFNKIQLGYLEQQGGVWDRDCKGNAVRRPNWTVSYPWHKWQGGDEKDGLDIWCAFEYNPDLTY